MSASAGLARPRHPPGVPGRVTPAAAGSEEPLPRDAELSPRRARPPRHGSAAPGSQSGPEPGTARLHSFIHKKEAQRSWEARPSRLGAGRAPHPRLPAPPCRGTDTHGNPPRRCYPSSRRPRRISRWRGCTARSGTGTGPPRTP